MAAAGLVWSGSRFARRSDRERADLDAVLERGALEGGLRLRIAQGRRLAVRRILHAHLDAVQADLAGERDLADIARWPRFQSVMPTRTGIGFTCAAASMRDNAGSASAGRAADASAAWATKSRLVMDIP
jgi:hypothetical protein